MPSRGCTHSHSALSRPTLSRPALAPPHSRAPPSRPPPCRVLFFFFFKNPADFEIRVLRAGTAAGRQLLNTEKTSFVYSAADGAVQVVVSATYSAVSLLPDMDKRPVPYVLGTFAHAACTGVALKRDRAALTANPSPLPTRFSFFSVVNTLYFGAPAMVWQLAAVLLGVAAVCLFWLGPAAHRHLARIMATDLSKLH